MGATDSKATNNTSLHLNQGDLSRLSLDQDKLKFVKEIDDKHYGHCKIFRAEGIIDHNLALVRSILPNDSETQLKMIQNEAQELMNLDHNSLIKLLHFEVNKQSELCSSFWQATFFFEYASNCLEEDIARRRKEEIFYQESELWHIIISVIAGLAYLRSKGIEHGDIQPSTILLSDEGKVKILPKPISQASTNFNSYTQALLGVRKARYLSPLLLKSLEQQYPNPQHNCSKSDVFSLGLIILEAALLQEQDDIYNFQEFEIVQSALQTKLQYVKEQYSEHLYQFLEQLLIFDEMERPEVDILFAYIQEMSQSGVRMADKTFSLAMRERQPTYNYSIEDQNSISEQITRQAPLNNANIHTQEAASYQTPLKTYASPEKIQLEGYQDLQANQGYLRQPLFVREEKVRRSKWTLDENNDNNIYVSAPSSSIQNHYLPPVQMLSSPIVDLYPKSSYTFGDLSGRQGVSSNGQALYQGAAGGNYNSAQISQQDLNSNFNIETINQILSKYTTGNTNNGSKGFAGNA